MKKYILCFLMVFAAFHSSGQTITYVYTKYGKAVEVFSRSDVGFDISYMNSYYQSMFPNATYLGTATQTYNCHFYAWHMRDGGSGVFWMNSIKMNDGTSNSNISSYWTSDYYSQTTVASAPKIFYYTSDHSAVASSVSGMYESKWGAAPLMRHAPGYGPYPNMGERRYYSHSTGSYQGLLAHNGYGEITVGIAGYYSASYLGGNVYGVWDVTNGKGDKDGFTETPSGNTNTIVFHRPGIYQLYYYYYLNGTEYLGYEWYEVLVSL